MRKLSLWSVITICGVIFITNVYIAFGRLNNDVIITNQSLYPTDSVTFANVTATTKVQTAALTATGLSTLSDVRATMLNSTSTNIGTLKVFTEGRLALLHATTTDVDTARTTTLNITTEARVPLLHASTTDAGTIISGNTTSTRTIVTDGTHGVRIIPGATSTLEFF